MLRRYRLFNGYSILIGMRRDTWFSDLFGSIPIVKGVTCLPQAGVSGFSKNMIISGNVDVLSSDTLKGDRLRK